MTPAALVGASIVTGYVAALTIVAKMAGENARWLVPLLIAGISIVDALFIFTVSSSIPLAAAAAAGFALTLFLQRFVTDARSWLHVDIYGWTPSAKPGRPEGGECQAARAIYKLLSERYG